MAWPKVELIYEEWVTKLLLQRRWMTEGIIENYAGEWGRVDIWNYPYLCQYFQFPSMFSKDCVISLRNTVQIFTVMTECNPSPPTPHNVMHLDSSWQDRITPGHFTAFLFYVEYIPGYGSLCRMHYPRWLVDNFSADLPQSLQRSKSLLLCLTDERSTSKSSLNISCFTNGANRPTLH